MTRFEGLEGMARLVKDQIDQVVDRL